MITRLAPTPSGFLHEGNVYNFLFNWLWARVNHGKVLLRIDDADASRFRMEYLVHVFRTLDALGLDWDVGPFGAEDFLLHWSQNKRQDLYHQLLSSFIDKDMIFACVCSRSQLAAADQRGVYAGTCELKLIPLDAGNISWRCKLPNKTLISFEDRLMGMQCIDVKNISGAFIVRRRDGIPSYHVCSLCDDLHFDVTHVARGYDLLNSTVCQRLLAQSGDYSAFSGTTFLHHPLLLNAVGEKLSKSAGDKINLRQTDKMEAHRLFGRFAAFAKLTDSSAPLSLQELKVLASQHEIFKK